MAVADTTDIRLGSRNFEQIRELAYRTFGLALSHGKKELVSARLHRLVRSGGFRSFDDYCRHVLSDSTGESLGALIDALVTNHTAFFREADHLDFLRAHVAPFLARRSSVDIWSAGCSTGEEAYTIVLALTDPLKNVRLHVVGSDISRKALAQAARAVYPADRIRDLPEAWMRAAFQPVGDPPDGYRVTDVIRSKVAFRRLNLIEPFHWPQPFPVIFCRNVMIYFDRATQQKVVTSLSANLEPGGYLFLGHAESLIGIRHALEYVRPAVYRKLEKKRGGA
jgi:chemotaxis protein methyltransferase CheR